MIDTVVFDFDGTLAHTNQLIINSFKYIYEYFENGQVDDDYIISTFGEPLVETFGRDFKSYDFEEVLTTYRNYQIKRFKDDVYLYDTVMDTLEELKKRNIKMGIATSRIRESTLEALEHLGISKYFDIIVAADDVKKHKPDKESLIKVLNGLKSDIKNTLYVGDSKYDMECAINSSVKPVLVGWQKNSLKLKEEYNIDYYLEKMYDIIGYIK